MCLGGDGGRRVKADMTEMVKVYDETVRKLYMDAGDWNMIESCEISTAVS